MKKFIYSLVTALALNCGFASCGNDNDEDITFSTSAEQGSAGTYSGTWSKTANGVETTSTGSVTLVAAGTANTNITLSCPEFDINATSIANITHASNGYIFNNNVATNPLEAGFAGRIDSDGTIQLNFQKEVREGRQRTIYVFKFVGKKS